MKKFITLFIGVFVFGFSFGQVEIEWQKTIGGSADDHVTAIQQTLDSGYIIGGSSNSNISGDKTANSKGLRDYWIIKLNGTGNIQWQKTIGGSGEDALTSIHQTSDGGYILGGWSNSNISGDKTENLIGVYDYWIVKTDNLGNIQWQNTIGGTDLEESCSIQQTADGGYILGGSSRSNISGDKTENNQAYEDYWIIKTDSAGIIQWQNTIGGNYHDNFFSIKQTFDMGFIIGGYSNSDSAGDKTENSNGGYDYWIVKVDSIGNIQWQNTIGGSSEDYFRSLEQTTDGGYVLGGYSNSNISGDKTETSINHDYWILKIDDTGNIQWQNTIGGSNIDGLMSLQQTSDGGYILEGWSLSNISVDKTENNNGKWDTWTVKLNDSGNIQWQNSIGGSDIEQPFCISETSDNKFIVGGLSFSNISGDKTENSRGSYDYWIVKLTDKYNLITGKTFIDFNSNQVKDSTDIFLQGHLITESNTNRIAFSEQNGNYSLSILDSGNFFVFPAPINNYTTVPVSHSGAFTGIKQTDSLNDFAFQPIAGINDLQISISPLTAFRPGFDASYLVSYKNVGTTTLTASVVFYLDDTNYTYLSASFTPSLITLDSLLWNNITLTPWQQGSITVTVHVNASVPIGTYLGSFCIINPIAGDNFTRDNYTSWKVLVTGSFDPNDKSVSYITFTTTQLADTNEYLDYIIRFQNTGTDTAFNVRVLDNMPANLDLTTFQLVASSHPFNMSYKAHSKLMTFTFDNILLPDSNTNELLSHGFIRYRIRPLSILAAGDTIKNTAFIYFDFNQPVQTNWAQTEIVLPNSVPALSFNDKGLKLYPNPVSDLLHIDYALHSNEKTSVKIFDVMGKVVYENKNSLFNTQINVSAFPVGVYVVELTQNGKAVRGRFVKD